MAQAVKNFFRGIFNAYEAQSIPRGSASRSLNWTTSGDKIELRRGYRTLGEELTGMGKAWVHVAQDALGQDVLFRKRGQKLEWFNETTQAWVETGSNIFGADAEDDEPSFTNYNSLAGAQLHISTPHSSRFKIMVANPSDYTDLVENTFRGKIRAKDGRMLLWQRQGSNGVRDLTGLYGSYIDKDEISDFTEVSAESIGSSGSLTYSGTLAFKGSDAKRTCFGVAFTDGSETFVDNYDGTLTGSAGGTGTINYTTGEYSVTFASAASGSVTCTYYWEFSGSTGIDDFSKSTPRTAGQGFILRQDDGGGKLQAVLGYESVYYCMHERKTWAVSLTNDDTNATNLPYRMNVGIPNSLAACETGDGIYYVDVTGSEPRIRLLTLQFGSTAVIPKDISTQLDLSIFLFDKCVVREWGNMIVFACRTADSAENNRLLVLDRSQRTNSTVGAWDLHDFYASSLDVYNGALVCGDSVSENAYELFSGVDDDESQIANYWEGNLDDLAIDGLKKSKRLKLQGAIGPDQEAVVSVSVADGVPVEVGRIRGDSPYVDHGQRVSVGAPTIGRTEIGGGGSAGDIPAYNYEVEFKLQLDTFEQVKVRFECVALGYFSASEYQFRDVRFKGRKVPRQYRVA